MTKSVVNAMLGVLAREHKLAIDAPAPVAVWSDREDPRHGITIDNLLRMTSGIDIGQSLTSDWMSAFDPSVQMKFDMPDMAAFAERARLAAPPRRVRRKPATTVLHHSGCAASTTQPRRIVRPRNGR
jgi:CubicO group peptidase (beta-lactamase class C family)